jgi:hypothetical protein
LTTNYNIPHQLPLVGGVQCQALTNKGIFCHKTGSHGQTQAQCWLPVLLIIIIMHRAQHRSKDHTGALSFHEGQPVALSLEVPHPCWTLPAMLQLLLACEDQQLFLTTQQDIRRLSSIFRSPSLILLLLNIIFPLRASEEHNNLTTDCLSLQVLKRGPKQVARHQEPKPENVTRFVAQILIYPVLLFEYVNNLKLDLSLLWACKIHLTISRWSLQMSGGRQDKIVANLFGLIRPCTQMDTNIKCRTQRQMLTLNHNFLYHWLPKAHSTSADLTQTWIFLH